MSSVLNNLDMGHGGVAEHIQKPLYGGLCSTSSGTSLPFVLPGETVETVPAFAVLEASPHRVAPGCDHFGTCGGCHYQHADYPTQLALKREILTDLLTGAGLTSLPAIQTESGPEWNYRNRIRLRLEGGRAGYSLRGTNDFLPIHECPIAAPALWQTGQAILQLAATDALVQRWLAITTELELLCTADESQIQLQFFLNAAAGAKREASSFPTLCDRVAASLAPRTRLAGAAALLDPELGRRERQAWSGVSWGAAGLSYPAAGRNYWLPRGAFFQVNRFLVDRLVTLVTASHAGELAWDLYAGVGLFTRALAESFEQVVAVEGAEAAIPSLQAAAKSPKGIEPVHSSTLDFLRAREHQRERPSLIVLDPPRAGLGPEAAQILTRLAAAAITYVSCDPTTLARDLAILTSAYRIEAISLIDLFPQTFHLETIVQLIRR